MSKSKSKKPIINLETLNSDQKKAFEELRDFIYDKSDDSVYVLKGWAGTGKTYCVSLLVRYALEVIHPKHNWFKIAVTGPTNKSVRVIKKTSGLRNSRVTFQTIHKLLGLTEKITNDGKQEFVNQGDFKPQIKTVRLLIVDEVSMLNDDLFHEILKYRDKIKIICMGDPAQIPPVGKPDCIPFREELADHYRIKTLQLNQIMRQKEGNAIIDSSVIIRKELHSNKLSIDNISKVNSNGEGVEFLNLNCAETRKGFSEKLRQYFVTEDFVKDSEYVKVIAWRNKTVATMNNIIRKTIYGDVAEGTKILEGEKLIANNPVIEDKITILNTNDEFTVERYTIENDTPRFVIDDHPDAEPLSVELKYYDTEVSYLNDADEVVKVWIKILHESSEVEFQKVANILKLRAIQKRGKDKSWIHYYNFLRRFADVSFAYAISCHKSQGSTYNTAFVLEDDIDMNWDVVERNRIKYTAYTRASRKLYVLKRF